MEMAISVALFVTAILFFALGRLTGMKEPNGTLIINNSKPEAPPFELHFFKDPDEVKTGKIVTFTLDVR